MNGVNNIQIRETDIKLQKMWEWKITFLKIARSRRILKKRIEIFDLTLPNLVAYDPVNREWKMIIVSSKSHTNTLCEDRKRVKQYIHKNDRTSN